jgi:hypothetical protein
MTNEPSHELQDPDYRDVDDAKEKAKAAGSLVF